MDGWNQNPPELNADATTRADLDHLANARLLRHHRIDCGDPASAELEMTKQPAVEDEGAEIIGLTAVKTRDGGAVLKGGGGGGVSEAPDDDGSGGRNGGRYPSSNGRFHALYERGGGILLKYAKFVGPGFMVAVAYIDPGMS